MAVIPGNSAIAFSMLREEFMPANSNSPVAFGNLRRGGTVIPNNAANNPAVNLCASVPTAGVMNLAKYRGTQKGWVYTNSVELTNYTMATAFGDNWNTNWPKTFVNNNYIWATSTGFYALIITGGLGSATLVNNHYVLGGGGVGSGAVGQHAMYINTAIKVAIQNNGAIFGGGGAGGVGGAGGTGGQGYYYTYPVVTEGPFYINAGNAFTYDAGDYFVRYQHVSGGSDYTHYIWNGANISGNLFASSPVTSFASGAYTYYLVTLSFQTGDLYCYSIKRQSQPAVVNVTPGGGGGGGGPGGRGIQRDAGMGAGGPGVPGTAGGANAGAGGTGGTGGTGGDWGLQGFMGNVGQAGGYGNYGGYGSVGAQGGAGGAGGYAIAAQTAFSLNPQGSIRGPIGPVAPT
jgi:hypothetical protein